MDQRNHSLEDRENRLLMAVSHSVEEEHCQKVTSLTGVRVIRWPKAVYHPCTTSLTFPSTSSLARATDSPSPHSPFPITKPPTDSPARSVSEGNVTGLTNTLIAF